MSINIINRLKVRREFTVHDAETVSVYRNCGLGCECGANIFKVTQPLEKLAESKTLCFNDHTKQGISEQPDTAKCVEAKEGVIAFEVDANLVEVTA